MNDAERADWLARAIDALLHGAGQDQPPDTQDDEDLTSLLRVVELRKEASDETRLSSTDHEAIVWKRLTQRLASMHAQPQPLQADHAEDIVEAIATRRPLYEDASDTMADDSEVWERLRQRLETPDARQPAGVPRPVYPAGDASPPGSAAATLTRRSERRAGAPDRRMQERLWDRMRRDPQHTTIDDFLATRDEPGFLSKITPKLAAVVAVAVVIMAALAVYL